MGKNGPPGLDAPSLEAGKERYWPRVVDESIAVTRLLCDDVRMTELTDTEKYDFMNLSKLIGLVVNTKLPLPCVLEQMKAIYIDFQHKVRAAGKPEVLQTARRHVQDIMVLLLVITHPGVDRELERPGLPRAFKHFFEGKEELVCGLGNAKYRLFNEGVKWNRRRRRARSRKGRN